MQYLKGTPGTGILFKQNETLNQLDLWINILWVSRILRNLEGFM